MKYSLVWLLLLSLAACRVKLDLTAVRAPVMLSPVPAAGASWRVEEVGDFHVADVARNPAQRVDLDAAKDAMKAVGRGYGRAVRLDSVSVEVVGLWNLVPVVIVPIYYKHVYAAARGHVVQVGHTLEEQSR